MDEPAPGLPWWRQLFAQYVVPTAIASIVATGLSVYTALNAKREQEREFSKSFEGMVTSAGIVDAFRGDDAIEQRAAATLLALQAVADTSLQKRTVLLTGARLLNANTDTEATGGPAARLLTILIDEDLRSGDASLRALAHSRPFLNLVTSGYTNDYYNDDTKRQPFTWATLNGDQPITHDAKLRLLLALTPDPLDGWVHLATFATSYDFGTAAAAPSPPPVTGRVPAQVERPQATLPRATAADFVGALQEVMLDQHVGRVTDLRAQYAIESPPKDRAHPLFAPAALVDRKSFPRDVLMLKPRLLRNRPPVEFVNPDGTFRKGSLGEIIGAVAAGTCVHLTDPLRPTLVFLGPDQTAAIPGARPGRYAGLVHMWAHVQPSTGCAFPAPAASAERP